MASENTNRNDSNPKLDSVSTRKNLNEAILVQARLIAQLRREVDKLKATRNNGQVKRHSIKN